MARRLLNQLAHVEIITSTLEESVNFFRELMGMEVVRRAGNSAYLRCRGDYYQYSLVLTEGPQPALGHISWRTEGAEELDIVVQPLRTGDWSRWYPLTRA